MSNKQPTSASGPRGSGSVGHGASSDSDVQEFSLKLDPGLRGNFVKSVHVSPSLANPVWHKNDDGHRVDPDFKYPGADLHLRVGDRCYWLHQDMLRDFKGLGPKFDNAPKAGESHVKCLALEETAQDVRNMLLMLYTKPYELPILDAKTLESCLKLATKYNNPELRSYAIKQLGQQPLEAVEQFRLGRDYDIGVWRMMAIGILSSRDEPLTAAEASILGPAEFTSIAAKREKLQYQKGQGARIFGNLTPASGTESATAAKDLPSASDSGLKKQLAELPDKLQAAVQLS